MSAPSGFDLVSPVVLSSSCVVRRNSTGLPDYGQLSYPFRKAIIIEEIRWTIRRDDAGSLALNLGAQVAMTMQMGRHFVAKNPVPIWLFGTVMDRSQEQSYDSRLATGAAFSQYRWRLPEPLYLEAGQILTPVFSRGIAAGLQDDGSDDTYTVQITYVGRTVSPAQPRPRLLAVPYVARFITQRYVNFDAAVPASTYQQSNENHLFNMFDKPLRIQRLTGRVFEFQLGSAAEEVQALTPTPAGIATALTIKMTDSWGGKMVNDPTGPSDVFDITRGAWTCDTMMPAKGQYLVKASNINIEQGQYLHIAMVGVREENL